jgi:hypothetical protein
LDRIRRNQRFSRASVLLIGLLIAGCEQEKKVLDGVVTVGEGQVPLTGQITLMPVDGHRAPSQHAQIVDGRFRIDARGGVLLGEYRVLIEGWRKTGRKTTVVLNGETVATDEKQSIVPEIYTSSDSPLLITVSHDFKGHVDFNVPAMNER